MNDQFLKDHYAIIQATLKKIIDQRGKDEVCICDSASMKNSDLELLLLKEEIQQLKAQNSTLQKLSAKDFSEKCLSIFVPDESKRNVCEQTASVEKRCMPLKVDCACGSDEPKIPTSTVFKKIDDINIKMRLLLENEEKICMEICSLKDHVQNLEGIKEDVYKLQASNVDVNRVLVMLKNTVTTLWEESQKRKKCQPEKKMVDKYQNTTTCLYFQSNQKQTELCKCKMQSKNVSKSQNVKCDVESRSQQTSISCSCSDQELHLKNLQSSATACTCNEETQTEDRPTNRCDSGQTANLVFEYKNKKTDIACACKSQQTPPQVKEEKICECKAVQTTCETQEKALQIKTESPITSICACSITKEEDSYHTASTCMSGESEKSVKNCTLLKDHFQDLEKERSEKEKHIKWLNELIAYYMNINDNLLRLSNEGRCDCSPDTLKFFIQKVIDENNKLKSTVSIVIKHLQGRIKELTPEPKSKTCQQYKSTEVATEEAADKKEQMLACEKVRKPSITPVICLCEEGSSQSSKIYSCTCTPDIRDIYNEVLCMCVPKEVTNNKPKELPPVPSPCTSKDEKEKTQKEASTSVCSCTSKSIESIVQKKVLSDLTKIEYSCEGSDEKIVLGNLSNYLSYLQQQLAIIMEIESQMEDIRDDIRASANTSQ